MADPLVKSSGLVPRYLRQQLAAQAAPPAAGANPIEALVAAMHKRIAGASHPDAVRPAAQQGALPPTGLRSVRSLRTDLDLSPPGGPNQPAPYRTSPR